MADVSRDVYFGRAKQVLHAEAIMHRGPEDADVFAAVSTALAVLELSQGDNFGLAQVAMALGYCIVAEAQSRHADGYMFESVAVLTEWGQMELAESIARGSHGLPN